MNLAHFVYHNTEVPLYPGEGSWDGRRLVAFGLGTTSTTGVCGYAHAIDLYVRPGRKIMSHWHDDREAVYYCIGGSGRFLLDEEAREVRAGDAMFQPLHAIHGADNPTGEDLRFIDVALFSRTPSPIAPGDRCFTSIARAESVEERGATWLALFPRSFYGNQAIEWCGEVHLAADGRLAAATHAESELFLIVLEGTGTVTLGEASAAVRPGSVVLVPAGCRHALAAHQPLRLFGARSRVGRVPPPAYFRRLASG